MPKPRLERPLSKPFADIVPRRGVTSAAQPASSWAAVSALALLLAGCGASTPRQAAVDAPATVVAPESTGADAPAEAPASAETAASSQSAASSASAVESKPERGSSGRRGRRSAESAATPEPSATDAETAAAEPIPEAVQQAYDRALAAMRAEDWLGAETELEQLTHDYPGYPGPDVNLAIVYLHGKRDDDARAALDRALAIEPENPQANNELGILLRRQGKFHEAEQAYRRALAADPSYALAHYNLGVLLDVYLRKPDEALEHYEFYQSSLAEPDKTVAGWIIDLRRRIGKAETSPVAKEDGQ